MAEIRPALSRPMTPALTPDSTVSMNWRAGLGLVAGGPQRRLLGLQVAGHAVEGVGQDRDLVRARRRSSTRAVRSPPATWSAACTSRPTGAEIALAAAMPSQTAPTSTSRAVSR